MSFKILLNENLKDKNIRDLYEFFNRFQSVDWGLFYYGFLIEESDIERLPKCSSFPTNYGSIIFPDFNYDDSKFVEHLDGYLSKNEIDDLKKELEEEEFLDIPAEIDRDVIHEVVSKFPGVIDSVGVELVIPIIVNVETLPRTFEEASILFERECGRMKSLGEFRNNIPPPFFDVEVHQWDLNYAEPKDVEKATLHLSNNDLQELSMDSIFEIIADLEEEPEEKGYVMLLRTEQDADITLKELELILDEGLSSIKSCITMKTCFPTLVI